jgi:hypothetical protein
MKMRSTLIIFSFLHVQIGCSSGNIIFIKDLNTPTPWFTNVIRSMKTVYKVKIHKYKIKFPLISMQKFWLVPDSQKITQYFPPHVLE